MPVFEKRTHIDAPAERVFAFHDRPEALTLLIPPWEPARVVEKTPGLHVGVRAVIEVRVGRSVHRVVAEHTACEEGRMFQDTLRDGPFKKWVHTHTMEPDGAGGSWLVDHIEYELPFGRLGALGAGWLIRSRMARMFDYRHEMTKKSCEAEAAAGAASRPEDSASTAAPLTAARDRRGTGSRPE
jgi:ligand-binding SRPBCC domain-containing protein